MTYERRKATRRCTRCNVPLDDDEGVDCASCVAEHGRLVVAWGRRNPERKAAIQKRYKDKIVAQRRAALLCVTCGEPSDTPHRDRCSVCHEKAMHGQRSARARGAA
jgi:hypothetical protein